MLSTEDGRAVRQQEPGSDNQGAAAHVTREKESLPLLLDFPYSQQNSILIVTELKKFKILKQPHEEMIVKVNLEGLL